jgi:hypothetical protein
MTMICFKGGDGKAGRYQDDGIIYIPITELRSFQLTKGLSLLLIARGRGSRIKEGVKG